MTKTPCRSIRAKEVKAWAVVDDLGRLKENGDVYRIIPFRQKGRAEAISIMSNGRITEILITFPQSKGRKAKK